MTRYTDFCCECEVIAQNTGIAQAVIEDPSAVERWHIRELSTANSYCLANQGAYIAFRYYPRKDRQQGLEL